MKAAKPSHYENFPVASWLCPTHLRPPIYAIYAFARAADDIADEGSATAESRLDDLEMMRKQLGLVADATWDSGDAHSLKWPEVFIPLGMAIRQFQMPVDLLFDLLDAFSQDIAKTRNGATYAGQAELLDYCKRSANPVGRLLLHLYGIQAGNALEMSDKICTALQLINFWQDLSRDIPNHRHYVTDAACHEFSVARTDMLINPQLPAITQLVKGYVVEAAQMMREGAPLCKLIAGRAGWELRLVVQGGLRILEKIEKMNFQTLHARPAIGKRDMAVMAWRSLWM